jgi:hypothetical protein
MEYLKIFARYACDPDGRLLPPELDDDDEMDPVGDAAPLPTFKIPFTT